MRDEDYFRFRVGEDTRKKDWFKTTLRVMVLLIIMIAIVFLAIWGYKSIMKDTTHSPQTQVIQKRKTKLSQAEIALIIKMVMQKMQKQQNQDIKLALKNKTIKKSEDSELLSSLQDLTPQKAKKNTKTQDIEKMAKRKIEKPKDEVIRKKVVYNAVIIDQKEVKTPADLAKLYASINRISRSKKRKILRSAYTKKIKKEIVIRKNATRTIVVRSGDTLSSIAKRAYGKSSLYTKILDANPDILSNPHRLKVGMRLRVPK